MDSCANPAPPSITASWRLSRLGDVGVDDAAWPSRRLAGSYDVVRRSSRLPGRWSG